MRGGGEEKRRESILASCRVYLVPNIFNFVQQVPNLEHIPFQYEIVDYMHPRHKCIEA